MLVRFVESTRRGDTTVPRGATLDIPDEEAAALIEQGAAVPVTNPDLAVERR